MRTKRNTGQNTTWTMAICVGAGCGTLRMDSDSCGKAKKATTMSTAPPIDTANHFHIGDIRRCLVGLGGEGLEPPAPSL